MSLNFAGLGFSFAAKGAKGVKTAFQGLAGAAGAALEILDGLTGTGQGLAHSIGTVLGGSLSLVVDLFKTVGSTALATGALIASAMALATAGISSVLGALEYVVTLGPNLAKSMGSALSSVGDQIQTLASAGRDLTSGMESELQQAGITARQMGGDFGYTGDKLNKFEADVVSMSQKLNIGASEAAKAHRAWIESSDQLTKAGFANETEFQRLNAALGTNGDMFRNNLLKMDKSMHLSGASMSRVLGSLQAMGQHAGDVSGALGKLDEVQKLMNRNMMLGGKAMPEEQMVGFTTSITGAATAFMALGQNSEVAMEHAFTLGDVMLSARENTADMFAGNADDLDSFSQELGITLNDIGKASELIKQGPAGFMEVMSEMVQKASKDGKLTGNAFVALNSRLTKLTGSKDMAADLLNVFQNMDDGTKQAVKTTREATSTLGALGNEIHRTGRSMEDEFARAQDIMFTKFRALGKPAATAWLKRVNQGMKEFGKTLQGFKGDDSPMGQFVNKMSEASSIGAQAFLPESMQATTVVMGTMLEKMGPTIDMMGKLGLNMTSISGIATTAAAGLAVWVASAMKAKGPTESLGQAMARTGKVWINEVSGMVHTAANWLGEIAKMFAEFEWDKLFSGPDPKAATGDGIDSLLAHAKQKFGDIDWAGIGANLWTGLSKMWQYIWGAIATDENKQFVSDKIDEYGILLKRAITDMMGSINWGVVFKDVFLGVMKALIVDIPKALAIDLPGALGEMLAGGASRTGYVDAKGNSLTKEEGRRPPVDKLRQQATDANEALQSISLPVEKLQSQSQVVSASLMSVSLPVEKLHSQSAEITQSIQSVHDDVELMSKNSLHTFIGDDMAKAVELTEKHSDSMVKVFDNLALQGQDAFAKMWYGITHDAEAAVNQISRIAENLVSNLEQIAVMKATITDAASQPSDRFAIPAANEERNRRIEQLAGDKAVHSPLWYEGAGGYKDLFSARMDRLIAVVEGLRFQTTPAAAGAAPKPPPKSFVPSPPPGGTRGVARTNSGSTPARR